MSTTTEIPSVLAKQQMVSENLREQIVRGKIAPGGRLPTQVELVEKFHVSGVTIQRALGRLVSEGFIETRGRNGTFVADQPPHLSRFGMVFVGNREPGHRRSRYYEMLEAQATRIQREGGRNITIFADIAPRENSQSTRNLFDEVRGHRMAGLILVGGEVYTETPLWQEPGVFRVGIMSHKVEGLQCPIVYPDMAGMIDKALDHLAQHHRKRVAVLVTVPVYAAYADHLRQGLKQRGMNEREDWIQIVPHDLPEAVRNVVTLMMSDPSQRPNGLFIADDHLTEGTSSGLVSAGIAVPRDIEVVAHCNFPWNSPSVLPVQRVGFDTRQIIDTAIGIIDQQRQGLKTEPFTKIEAVFEDQAR